jgi:uncharacterized membrane protein (DUF106 family)
MMELLTQVVVWLNAAANLLQWGLLVLLSRMPGWLSATLVSIISGVLFLLAYKYTSNQRAIKRVKDDIKANLLALKLFKDSAWVALQAQGRILEGAFELLLFSLVPMLVMIVPVLLILGQLALWYQARPLRVGEEAVVTVKLKPGSPSAQGDIQLEPTSAVEATLGPVHVWSKDEVCWNIRASRPGYHRLVFHVDGQTAEKELAAGDGFMRVSKLRPGWHWLDALLNPSEKPFAPDSPIQSIEIDYPSRPGWASGTDNWVIYWFLLSMAAGFAFRRPLRVTI